MSKAKIDKRRKPKPPQVWFRVRYGDFATMVKATNATAARHKVMTRPFNQKWTFAETKITNWRQLELRK